MKHQSIQTKTMLRAATLKQHASLTLPSARTARWAVAVILMLFTTATAWAQDNISGLTYNSAGGYYEINDAQDLADLATYVNAGNNASGKTFRQTQDIDMSGAGNFTSIGCYKPSNQGGSKSFSGTYDGNGKTISNLSINASTNMQGLFGRVENATIQNLNLSGASVSSSASYVGAFVGWSNGGLTMTNCHAVNCTVSSTSNYVGIFVGYLTGSASIIKSCTATGGSVSGFSEVGAIVGYSYASKANTHKIVGCVGRVTGGANVVGANTNNCVQVTASYGADAYTITAGEGVTITYSAVSNTYSDVIHPPYIVAGETVPVTLGYTGSLSNYTFQATGATLNDEGTQLSNAQGNVTITATEAPRTDISSGSVADIAVQTWTGSALTPAVVVTVGGKTLTATTDYIVNYTDNTHIGTATATVTGTGAYTGTLSKTFRIQHTDMPYNSNDDCYEIGNESALRALSTYVSSGGATSSRTFKQTQDISLTSAFSPIGRSSYYKFQGTYDGDKKTISGLSVSGNVQYAALFGYMVGANVKNVVLISPNVSSSAKDSGVSALVGYMNVGSNNSVIDNCIVINPSLSATGGGTNYVGVLCAYIQQSNITNCHYYDSNAEHSYPIAGYYNPSYSTVSNSERVYAITANGYTVSATATISVNGTDYYTSGTAATVTATVPSTGMKKFTITGTTASLTETLGQYTLTVPTNDVTVSLADVAPTIAVAAGSTYNGNAQTPEITSVMDGETAMTLETDYTNVAYSNNTNAGEGIVTITGKGWYVGTATKTFTISPASVTLTANSRNTDIYDGTEKTVTGYTCSVEGLTFEGVTASGSGTNAGEYDVTFTGVSLNTTTDASGNYVITATTNGKLTIGKATPTVTAPTAIDDLIYNGSAQALVTTGSTDFGTLLYSLDGNTYAADIPTATDAANYTVYYKVEATDNWNAVDAATVAVSIAAKAVTVTADDQTKEYGQADPTLTATVEGLIGEDAITYTLSRIEGEAVGTYDIIPAGDAAQGNYAVTFVAGTMTITSNPTLTLTANLAPDENYWTTFYCGDAGYTIDAQENACAYTATVSTNVITLHKLGKEIPAGTAVIIVADNNAVSMTKASLDDFSGTNDLRGVDVETSTADIQSTLGSGTFYVLGMTTVGTEQHFGFHKYEGTTMAARKAFVLINGSNVALARSLTMVFDDATGIKSVQGERFTVNGSDAWFTLDGRRLQGKPTKSGVYVNNGKKIVIK